MSTVTVNTSSLRVMGKLMPKISWSINQEIKEMARIHAQNIEDTAKAMLGSDDQGWDPITETTRELRTNPDNGPLLDVGYLRDSIKAVARRNLVTEYTADIVMNIGPVEGSPAYRKNGQAYDVTDAAFLMEFGGEGFNGTIVPPRPFLRPALLAEEEAIRKDGMDFVRKGIMNAT